MLSRKVSQFVKKDDNEDDMDTAISTMLITEQTETVDIYFVHEIDSKNKVVQDAQVCSA